MSVALGDNTPGSLNPNTVITGYGAPVTLIGVDTANLDATSKTVSAVGTSQNDSIVFTPTGATAGTFYNNIASGNNLVPNTVFNLANVTGDFTVFGGSGGNADEVVVRGHAPPATCSRSTRARRWRRFWPTTSTRGCRCSLARTSRF